MGSTQQFCLKWNNHQSNMLSIFDQLLSSEHFVDVTLACDGLSVRAHKMVLSACSPFFQSLFIQNPCEHPIVILKDIRFVDLKALVQFMYRGEVNVSQDQLPTLLKAAEALKIKGLAEVTNESGQKPTVGGSLGVSHNGHHSSSGGVTKTEQPSVQAAPSPLSSTPAAIASTAPHGALVAAMQQNALKAQLAAAAQAAQVAAAAAAAAAAQNAHESRQSVVSAASHESNSNASTPLRQTDSPMSQQNRKRRRKSAGSDKGSGEENSGPDSGAEDNIEEARNSEDESAGEEAEFEPSKLLEQSMTEVRQGHQDNNSSSSDNHTKDSNQADMKPVINFDTATSGNALALNPQDPSAVLAFAAAAQAAGAAAASATPGDSVAGPSQPTHGAGGGRGAVGGGGVRVGVGVGVGGGKGSGASSLLIYCADTTKVVPSKLIIRLDSPGDFNFQCSLCGVLFKRRKQAQEHSYKHSDKFPYECHFCSYGTVRSYNLKRHCERLHSSARADHKADLRKSSLQPASPDAKDSSGIKRSSVILMPPQGCSRSSSNNSPTITSRGDKAIPIACTAGATHRMNHSPSTTVEEEVEATMETLTSALRDLKQSPCGVGGKLCPSKREKRQICVNSRDVIEDDRGDDSDCLMIEESVTDVEDLH